MLTSLRIQNFRSIRDASVKLGQVNLFIGPNNSGKSNFLKGVEVAAYSVRSLPTGYSLDEKLFDALLPRNSGIAKRSILFDIELTNVIGQTSSYFLKFDNNSTGQGEITPLSEEDSHEALFASLGRGVTQRVHNIKSLFSSTKLYKIEPAGFALSTALSDEAALSPNGENIAAFIYTLSQNEENRFAQLRSDFARCVGTLTSLTTPPDPDKKGNLKLKFFDPQGNSYWAEEVSEGVLYFLALLCIVHQPDPPKLLLLEEPEKGIHPRRIREVMDFIFELARLRDIQIILTSHSPYVVDHFKDIPECISVFDRDPKTGETVINNAKDLIDKTNAERKLDELPEVDYTSSLGEYWVSGFLGGVPL